MERLPLSLSQPPFSSGHLSLSSPTMHSPRAGLSATLIQGLPSPPALHSNIHGSISTHHHKVRPSSSSSLSSVHTPPPYGDSTMMGSAGPPVYSPTHAGSLLPLSSAERHHEQLTCHGSGVAGADPGSRHSSLTAMPSLTSLMGHQPLPIVSSAQETSCGSAGLPVATGREHQSSPPSGKDMQGYSNINTIAIEAMKARVHLLPLFS